MKRTQARIEFEIPITTNDMLLFEQLRYAGLLNYEAVRDGMIKIIITQPHGLIGEVWARQNIDRMKSFGITAKMIGGQA